MEKTFDFHKELWKYEGKAAWYFVTLPTDVAAQIDFYFAHVKRGWGSLRVKVRLGNSTWLTSIFADKKNGSYLLPIKKTVRKNEDLQVGETYHFEITVLS